MPEQTPETMRQEATYPAALRELVPALRYKPGWYFTLNDIDRGQGSLGLTLIINIHTENSYQPEQHISVNHYMPVPPAAYDERSWRRWLFDQILLVERHEACEFFTLAGDKPYAPSHGPGNDPYLIREVGTDVDRRTSFRGEIESAPDVVPATRHFSPGCACGINDAGQRYVDPICARLSTETADA